MPLGLHQLIQGHSAVGLLQIAEESQQLAPIANMAFSGNGKLLVRADTPPACMQQSSLLPPQSGWENGAHLCWGSLLAWRLHWLC